MAAARIERLEFPVHRNRTLKCPCIANSPTGSVTARRAAAGFLRAARLNGSEKSAHELSVDLRSDGVHVDSLPREEFAGVVRAIDARGLDFNLCETGRRQLAAVIILFQCASDAAYPGQNALADFGQHVSAG